MGWLACQPIVTARKRCYGDELLYRSSASSRQEDAIDGKAATRGLRSVACSRMGMNKSTGGKRSVVKFTGELRAESGIQL